MQSMRKVAVFKNNRKIVKQLGINMVAITINISEHQLQKLQELAQKLGISTEELLSASVEDLLNHPKSDFTEAANYVMQKNAELYRRLG